jgi:hypothetical protein
VAGQVGLSAAFGLLYFVLVAGAVLLAMLLANIAAAPALIVLFVVIVVLAFLGCMLVHATLSGIYSAVLYRYAVGGSDAPGFDRMSWSRRSSENPESAALWCDTIGPTPSHAPACPP